MQPSLYCAFRLAFTEWQNGSCDWRRYCLFLVVRLACLVNGRGGPNGGRECTNSTRLYRNRKYKCKMSQLSRGLAPNIIKRFALTGEYELLAEDIYTSGRVLSLFQLILLTHLARLTCKSGCRKISIPAITVSNPFPFVFRRQCSDKECPGTKPKTAFH
jgi:hypothetical protein